jgi:hypothetical protein
MIDLKKLYWDGIAPAGTWSGVEDFRRHLKGCHQYPGHVIAHGDGVYRLPAEAENFPVTCHRPEAVLSAPGFFALTTSFLPVAEEYLGVAPLLYSVNAFWTRPTKKAPNPHIQQWHRDRDDLKFLVLFVYLTDVEHVSDGAHFFATGSHRQNDQQNRAPQASEEVEVIFGPAGTMFLADTSGIHMGEVPWLGKSPRGIAWARFGVSERPAAYGWDKTTAVPASTLDLGVVDASVQRATRLIVDWSK